MPKKYFYLLAGLILLAGSFFITGLSLAQGEDIGRQLGAAAGKSGANLGAPMDPRLVVAFIIRALLGVVGTVLVVLNIYAGFLWMTAGGNEDQVTSAKTTIRNATIGLIVVLSAYSITRFAANLARSGSGFGFGSFFGL